MKDDVNIYSSKMLVEELGKIRSSSAASGNKDDERSWVDITFTVRSPLLLSFIQKAVATETKKEAAASSSPTKKKATTPAQKKLSPKKKTTVPKEKGATKKKSPNSITTKKSPSATNVTVAERNNLDQQTTAVDTIKAAARFRLAQAELALEFASAQLRSAMNELEDARVELNRAENGSIIVTAPQQSPQQQGKTTG